MSDIVTRLRAWREIHLTRLGAMFDEAADTIDSLRREVREQRLEIAGLREERRAILDADRPMMGDMAPQSYLKIGETATHSHTAGGPTAQKMSQNDSF